MRSNCRILFALIVVAMSVPAAAFGEIYFPPRHVRDSANPTKEGEPDLSVPFIYLEPHEGCFDMNQPLTVTIYAVNRSGKSLTVDWNEILGSLSLEAIGPGKARPLQPRPKLDSTEAGLRVFASQTINLKDFYELKDASVYRLSYVRPLSDGRIHVASPVSFVVEDSAAIDSLTKELDDAAARQCVAELLKCNPHFAQGPVLKTYGWDQDSWPQPEMREIRWQWQVGKATARWQQGIEGLARQGATDSEVRALETIVDRLVHLSDNLRIPLGDRPFYLLTRPVDKNLKPQGRERIHLKLARSRDIWVASQSIGRLGGHEIVGRYGYPLPESVPALETLIAIADGSNKDLANTAMSSLSNYRTDPRITQFLRRKMSDADGALALQAAIITCYSGDWSGFPVLLRCARSEDPQLRLRAIAQLVDIRYQKHSARVVPLLLAELKQPLSDRHLERAVESLGTYARIEVVEAITPLLEHQNDQVKRRARLSLDRIERERSR